jgi:hypothetical protein
MKRYVNKIGKKTLIAILYFFLLLVFAGLFSSAHEAIVGHMEDARSTGAWALSEIYKSTLEYRFAEMEQVLSFNEKEMRDYESRMKAVLQLIKQNQEEYMNLLSSREQREAYEEYVSDWQAYLGSSRQSIALARNHLNDRAIAIAREKARGSFQLLIKRLDNFFRLA